MKAITFSEFICLTLIATFTSSVKSCGQIEYCGGAHGDFEQEISCTCYPAKNKDFPPYTWQDYCNADVLAKYAGSSKGAKAWQSPGADNYWVFHGCDGAGLMDDCMGGSTYVEQFGPYSNEQLPLTLHECSGGWESHCTQPFAHPGTDKVYDWYNAGQLTYAGGKWPDQTVPKPWWDNMGLPDTDQLGGNDPGVAFVVLYPWVCGYNDPSQEDVSWLWGNHKPYGDKTYETKCWYDNEPWDNDHFHGTTIPPIWQAYKFYYDDASNTISGWMLAEKTSDHKEPFYYYQNNPDPFVLQAVGSPPWLAEE